MIGSNSSIYFLIRLIAATVAASAVMSCSHSQSTTYDAVPRPEAYFRIEPYPSGYMHPELCGNLWLLVNDSATITRPSPSQISISYPRYRAVVHCTVTPVNTTSIRSVIDNRTQRISLNAGSNPSVMTEISDSAFTSYIVVTPAGSITPLQFIATDSTSVVLSGAAVLSGNAPARSDSIAPVIESLSHDISRMLRSLHTVARHD